MLDPGLLGLMTMMAGGPNWRQFASMADQSNLPLPGTPEWENLINPGSGELGNLLQPASITGPGASGPGSLMFAGPPPATDEVPPITGDPTLDQGPMGLMDASREIPRLPDLFGPDTQNIGPGTPGTLDLATALGINGPGTGPGAGPGGVAKGPATNTQRRFPNVRMPEAPKPEFRGGVAGAQKAPDMGARGSVSPAQALMAALLGPQGNRNPLRVPALGELLGGRGG